jgi:hypothetical protein
MNWNRRLGAGGTAIALAAATAVSMGGTSVAAAAPAHHGQVIRPALSGQLLDG